MFMQYLIRMFFIYPSYLAIEKGKKTKDYFK